MKKHFSLVWCLLLFSFTLSAQVLTPVVDSIPMRDGKKIAADRYVPAGCTSCPVILIQTPYNRLFLRLGLPLGVGTNINTSNYAFVVTDWRGFFGSSAAAAPGTSQGEDGYDVVEWIAQQPWCNTMIGTWGPSALGRVQFATMRENPPSLRCAVPVVAGPQFSYQEYYPGGVARTEYIEQLDALGFGVSTVLYANQVRNLTWQMSEATTFYPGQITKPMLMIGGWYDHNVRVMLEFFNGVRQSSPLNVRDQHRLLMGPWVHGGSGVAFVGSATQGQLSYPNAAGRNDSLTRVFFDYHLIGIANGWDQTAFVNYYQMGEDAWHASAQWPVQTVTPTTYYLQNASGLSLSTPSLANDSTLIPYNPSDPSPTVGGTTLRADLDQGPYDQAPVVEARSDVAIYSTPVLTTDLVLQGSVVANLHVTSNRFDTDFAVRLVDKYPDGRSMLVTDGIRRLRFRNGFAASDTSNIVPGQIYTLSIQLPATSITIKAGHRLQIDITNSIYPKYDSNLNNGQQMYTQGDTLPAVNVVYHNNQFLSSIILPVMSAPLGIESQVVQSGLQVYPNPVSDRLRVYYHAPLGSTGVFELWTVAGNKVLSHAWTNLSTQLAIEIGHLPAGVYIGRLVDNYGNASHAKVVIAKH